MLSLSSRIITALTVCMLLVKVSPLQLNQLRDLQNRLNDEEREMEEEFEDIEEIKTELLKRSLNLETRSRQNIRKGEKEDFALHRHNNLQIRSGENVVIVPAGLPKTPKPPEKVQKATYPPTPAGPPRVVYPAVPDKIQQPKPKYVWDGEKFVRVPPLQPQK